MIRPSVFDYLFGFSNNFLWSGLRFEPAELLFKFAFDLQCIETEKRPFWALFDEKMPKDAEMIKFYITLISCSLARYLLLYKKSLTFEVYYAKFIQESVIKIHSAERGRQENF